MIDNTKLFSVNETPTRRSSRNQKSLISRNSIESSSDISSLSEGRMLRSKSSVSDVDSRVKQAVPEVKRELEVPNLTGYKTSALELRSLRIPLFLSNVLPKSRFMMAFQDNGVKDGKIIEISKKDGNKCWVYTTYAALMKPNIWKYSCTDCRRQNKLIYAYRILKSGVVLASDRHICRGRSLDEELKKQVKYQSFASELTKPVPSNLWVLPCEEERMKNILFIVSEKDPKLGCRFVFQGKDTNGSLVFTCESCSNLNTVTCAAVSFKEGKIAVTTELDEEHESHCFTVSLKEALSKEKRILINPEN